MKRGIVTGAGSGLGEAGARRLARDGFRLVVTDRNAEAVERVAKEITAAGGEAVPFVADVADYEAVTKLAEFAVEAYGGFDVAFNNAGITNPQTLLEVPPETFEQVLEVNVAGAFKAIRAFAPSMLARRYGRIVNIASVAGKEGNPNASAYSTSKAAVIGLTK